jgi:hypothetical protein
VVETIPLERDAERLENSLKDDLAGMPGAARPPSRGHQNPSRASASLAEAFVGGGDSKRSPATGDLLVQ